MTEPRFLVVRLGSLGDIVHTFPAVAALRASYPLAEIVWLTHPRWTDLVASSTLATEIWPVDSRDLSNVRAILAKIRAQSWQASIDYQGLWKSALLPFLGGVRKRIGFSSATVREFGVPLLYTDRVSPKTIHIADQNGELSLRAGAAQPVSPVTLQVKDADRQRVCADLASAGIDRYIVLSPGGGWRSKCWPADRFGALCQKIREQLDLRCVINYGPGEEALADAVKAASGNAAPIAYDGEMGQLMASAPGRTVHRWRRHRPAASRHRAGHPGRRYLRPHQSRAQWTLSAPALRAARSRRGHHPRSRFANLTVAPQNFRRTGL